MQNQTSLLLRRQADRPARKPYGAPTSYGITLVLAALDRMQFYDPQMETLSTDRARTLARRFGVSPGSLTGLAMSGAQLPLRFELQLKSRAFRNSVCRLIDTVEDPHHLAAILASLGLTHITTPA